MINRAKPKPSTNNHFNLEELHRFVQEDKRQSKQLVSKKLLPPKIIMKNHSKSLYYCNNLNRNVRPNVLNSIYRTSMNENSHQINYINHQTLNEELLGLEKPKPQTSHYNSGRNRIQERSSLRSNKISLRSSSNYNRLSSVAGISLNEKEAQERMQSQLNTKCNIRNIKLDEIRKENKRLSERLDSQQSQYSTKKLLKAYESQERISRRLTESKMSKRSHSIQDNRSVCSEHSSRSSMKSRSSNNSQTSSMKSTGRNYLPNNKSSSKKNTVNRLQAKLNNVGTKNIKIEEHNINKLTEDEFSKFKKLFGNSFSTVKPEKTTNEMYKQNNLSYQKMLSNKNPYADVEVMSEHSQSSQKSIDSRKRAQNYTTHNSNRKLKEFNFDLPHSHNKMSQEIPKKSSAITSDGLLHRIAEEMYTINKNGKTDDITNRQDKKKRDSINTNSKSMHQENKTKEFTKSIQRKPNKAEFNYPILPTKLVFGKV